MKRILCALALFVSMAAMAQDVKDVEIEGLKFKSLTQSDVTIAVNMVKVNNLGKYYALNMQLANASGKPVQIDSYADIKMTAVQGKGKNAQEVPVKMYTREEYIQAIENRLQRTRQVNAAASALTLAESITNPSNDVIDVLIDVKAEKTQIDDRNEMIELDVEAFCETYVVPCTLAAGETKLGYLMFEREKGKEYHISVTIEGVPYEFIWK